MKLCITQTVETHCSPCCQTPV